MELSEAFRSEVRVEFAFLVADLGFNGPERTDHGLLFHHDHLDIEVWFLTGHEPEVATLVAPVSSDGTRGRRVFLHNLYVAGGYGPAQDVPSSAQTPRTTLKRVRQQASALRRLPPQSLGPEGGRLIALAAERWAPATAGLVLPPGDGERQMVQGQPKLRRAFTERPSRSFAPSQLGGPPFNRGNTLRPWIRKAHQVRIQEAEPCGPDAVGVFADAIRQGLRTGPALRPAPLDLGQRLSRRP